MRSVHSRSRRGSCRPGVHMTLVPNLLPTAPLASPLGRDNVLLGRRYDAARLQAVLHACALLPDLREMPAGDQTLGEPGNCMEAAWNLCGALSPQPGHAPARRQPRHRPLC